MAEKPILFSGKMVRAIKARSKTQTRRLSGLEKVNENPDQWNTWGLVILIILLLTLPTILYLLARKIWPTDSELVNVLEVFIGPCALIGIFLLIISYTAIGVYIFGVKP